MTPDHSTPPCPPPAAVGRAVAAALVTNGSSDALRLIVCDYVRALKEAGLPPETALARVKDAVGVAAVTSLQGLLPSDRLAADVVKWFVAEYYRAG